MEHSRFITLIEEQLLEENINENICIIPTNDSAYYVYTFQTKNIYQFLFNKYNVKENDEKVDLWIFDSRTLDLAKYAIGINEYNSASSGANRLSFTEKNIQMFINDKKKKSFFEHVK